MTARIWLDGDLAPLSETQNPVDYIAPKDAEDLATVLVYLAPGVQVAVYSAAEAQELEQRFAAARTYLSREPLCGDCGEPRMSHKLGCRFLPVRSASEMATMAMNPASHKLTPRREFPLLSRLPEDQSAVSS